MPQKPTIIAAAGEAVTRAKQGEIANQRRRGPEDPVNRARSQIWLAMVKSHRKTPDGHAAMGAFFLGDVEEAARVFARIEHHASDPGLSRKSLSDQSVVERVASKLGFAHTKVVYESGLWQLLEPTLPSPPDREEMINQATAQLILVEAMQDPAFDLLMRLVSICRYPPTPERTYRNVVRHFARKRSITCIYLLCLLYRRAIEEGAVGEMRILREGVLAAVRNFCSRRGFSGAASTLFLFLIRRRVLAGQSSLEHTFAAESSASQLLLDWSIRCETPEDYQWLDYQEWLGACAAENRENQQCFKGTTELPIEVEALICERDVLHAMTRDPVARRLERVEPRLEGDPPPAL